MRRRTKDKSVGAPPPRRSQPAATRDDSRRSVPPKLGVRLPRLLSQQRRARKTPTLTAKGTTKAVAPPGPASPWRGPAPQNDTQEHRKQKDRDDPAAQLPSYRHQGPSAQHREANSHQLEHRRQPPNLPPNEETSSLSVGQPFVEKTHFRFRGTKPRSGGRLR